VGRLVLEPEEQAEADRHHRANEQRDPQQCGNHLADRVQPVAPRSREIVHAGYHLLIENLLLARPGLPAFMPLGPGATPLALNPVERGLADLWSRTVASMPESSRRTLRRSVLEMTGSWLWELANQIKNQIPDPVDYVEMRRKTFGADLTMSLSASCTT